MNHFEFSWTTAANITIYGQGWQPADAPRAVVCLVHGIGEHSGRYRHVAAAFCEIGVALIAHDHQGHGQSQGVRGDILTYEDLLDGIAALLAEAAQRYPGLPCLLYGHSMGGNLVLNYVLRRRPSLAGVIVTAPWLRLSASPPAYQRKLLGVANVVWPTLILSRKLDTSTLSRAEAVISAYLADPLVHNRVSVRLFYSGIEAANWAMRHAAEFHLPLLLIHGTADRLTDPEASRQFAAAIPEKCTLKLWPELYHEVHNEPEQAEVISFITDWVEQQLKSQ